MKKKFSVSLITTMISLILVPNMNFVSATVVDSDSYTAGCINYCDTHAIALTNNGDVFANSDGTVTIDVYLATGIGGTAKVNLPENWVITSITQTNDDPGASCLYTNEGNWVSFTCVGFTVGGGENFRIEAQPSGFCSIDCKVTGDCHVKRCDETGFPVDNSDDAMVEFPFPNTDKKVRVIECSGNCRDEGSPNQICVNTYGADWRAMDVDCETTEILGADQNWTWIGAKIQAEKTLQ